MIWKNLINFAFETFSPGRFVAFRQFPGAVDYTGYQALTYPNSMGEVVLSTKHLDNFCFLKIVCF